MQSVVREALTLRDVMVRASVLSRCFPAFPERFACCGLALP